MGYNYLYILTSETIVYFKAIYRYLFILTSENVVYFKAVWL